MTVGAIGSGMSIAFAPVGYFDPREVPEDTGVWEYFANGSARVQNAFTTRPYQLRLGRKDSLAMIAFNESGPAQVMKAPPPPGWHSTFLVHKADHTNEDGFPSVRFVAKDVPDTFLVFEGSGLMVEERPVLPISESAANTGSWLTNTLTAGLMCSDQRQSAEKAFMKNSEFYLEQDPNNKRDPAFALKLVNSDQYICMSGTVLSVSSKRDYIFTLAFDHSVDSSSSPLVSAGNATADLFRSSVGLVSSGFGAFGSSEHKETTNSTGMLSSLFGALGSSEKKEVLMYGHTMTLQLQANSLWLCGNRGKKHEMVGMKDINSDGEQPKLDCYNWVVHSKDQFDSALDAAADPLFDTPVQYGHTITLQVGVTSGPRWLCGGRGKGNKQVLSRDIHSDVGGSKGHLKGLDNRAVYNFIIRSADEGSFQNLKPDDTTHKDPLHGEPVHFGQQVILQVCSRGKRWLSGGRDGMKVETQDIHGECESRPLGELTENYTWIVGKDHASWRIKA
jgi:hypothetical protein